MNGYEIFCVICMGIGILALGIQLWQLIRKGKPIDFSERRGNTGQAVFYAFTGAMSPVKKESAFLHLPTYTAGIIYHIGTFTGILILILRLSGIEFSPMVRLAVVTFFALSTLSGLAMLIKRFTHNQLKALSNPDDYLSNLLVTTFHAATCLVFFLEGLQSLYFVVAGLLFLYLPVGKLKHTVYFFAARYHLGFYYGWRGVWPYK